jgi:methanol--5-hydroxybenzimidazolylcobamide Co-methyltransferase
MEQLSYVCRLMNTAARDGQAAALQLRDWLCRSDSCKHPQALILAPESVITIARAMVEAPTHNEAGKASGRAAIGIMRDAYADGRLSFPERKVSWPNRMESTLAELPENDEQFVSDRLALADPERVLPSEYGHAVVRAEGVGRGLQIVTSSLHPRAHGRISLATLATFQR